jgi:hypothetical protein
LTFESAPELASIGEAAFIDCSLLSSICIPSRVREFNGLILSGTSVREISVAAENPHLKVSGDVLLNSSGTSIKRYFGTAGEVLIEKHIEELDSGCFSGCLNLSSVVFEAGSRLLRVKSDAFYACPSLLSICVPSGVQEWSGIAMVAQNSHAMTIAAGNRWLRATDGFLMDFQGISIKRYFGAEQEVRIANHITKFGAGCFCHCPTISCVIFESGARLSRITSFSFYDCSSLSSICIPSAVEAISSYAFADCKSLATVTFESPSHVFRLGHCAFTLCPALSSIAIPASVTTILPRCFRGCPSLSFTFESVSRLGSIDCEAFWNCGSLSSILIPSAVHRICRLCFAHCTSLATVQFDSGSGLLFIGDRAFTGCSSLGSICIPSCVETLGQGCFCGCTRLSAVNFASDSRVSCVGKSAFSNCARDLAIRAPSPLHAILHEYRPLLHG